MINTYDPFQQMIQSDITLNFTNIMEYIFDINIFYY